MSKEEKRGIPFPGSYGGELPLPSDMALDSLKQTADQLQVLWLVIRGEPEHGKNIQGNAVTRFFQTLEKSGREDLVAWLEGSDPKWRKPRAVLIKERAVQLSQNGDLSLLESNQELAEEYRLWIKEASSLK